MRKMKTKKGILKRFKITKKGKILRGHQYSRHLKAKKTKKQLRRYKEPTQLIGKQARNIKKLLGYG